MSDMWLVTLSIMDQFTSMGSRSSKYELSVQGDWYFVAVWAYSQALVV